MVAMATKFPWQQSMWLMKYVVDEVCGSRSVNDENVTDIFSTL